MAYTLLDEMKIIDLGLSSK